MGMEQNGNPEVTHRLRQYKIYLGRLTPNNRIEGANLGVSDKSVADFKNVQKMGSNLPLALVALHSQAKDLLSAAADEIDCDLVERVEPIFLNGKVDDERDGILIALGEVTKRLHESLHGTRTPGRVDPMEAKMMLSDAAHIQKLAGVFMAELRQIMEDG